MNIMYKERLKNIRDNKETLQKDIAKILNIKDNTYSEYENEYKIIPIKHLSKICNYFNVSLDYIFNFTNKENYSNIRKEINKELTRNRLKELRKENNLTQEKLAKIINVAKSTISDCERMSTTLATPFLYDICKKYNISADYLLGKIDQPKKFKK